MEIFMNGDVRSFVTAGWFGCCDKDLISIHEKQNNLQFIATISIAQFLAFPHYRVSFFLFVHEASRTKLNERD